MGDAIGVVKKRLKKTRFFSVFLWFIFRVKNTHAEWSKIYHQPTSTLTVWWYIFDHLSSGCNLFTDGYHPEEQPLKPCGAWLI